MKKLGEDCFFYLPKSGCEDGLRCGRGLVNDPELYIEIAKKGYKCVK